MHHANVHTKSYSYAPALVGRPDELLGGDLVGEELRRDEGQSDAGQQSRHLGLARVPLVLHPPHHGLEDDLLGGHVKLVLAHYLANLKRRLGKQNEVRVW